jgi:trimethylguanosine synthase
MNPHKSLQGVCLFYKDKAEVPWDIQKLDSHLCLCLKILTLFSYYQQRHKIFSKYDEGVWMTDDSWFGVTPEPVAKYVTRFEPAQHLINDFQAI